MYIAEYSINANPFLKERVRLKSPYRSEEEYQGDYVKVKLEDVEALK